MTRSNNPGRRYPVRICVLLILIFFFGIPLSYAQELIFIVNPSVPLKEISTTKIKKLYTGKMQYWGDGEAVTLGYLKDKEVHKKFTKTYVKKSPRQFTNFWRNQIFIGQAQMLPKGFNTQKEMIEFVSGTTGAIGYVSSTENLSGVKTIPVKGK